eukprot:TRINITY_DN13815_c0_g1_i11.p1 TRINITY_DN13815_c0_g1~~TRINITY_DN13815_c0_g1_i11.p1  ORF type:complete len:422 (-),score=103.20 TRINITY_DN13815_c0_g1_i11:127-1392(-)
MAELLMVFAGLKMASDVLSVGSLPGKLLLIGDVLLMRSVSEGERLQATLRRLQHKELAAAKLALEQAAVMKMPQLLRPKLQLAMEESLRALGILEDFEDKLAACRIHCFSVFAHAAVMVKLENLDEDACLRDAKLAAHVALKQLLADPACCRMITALRSGGTVRERVQRLADTVARSKSRKPEDLLSELAQLSWTVWKMPPTSENAQHPHMELPPPPSSAAVGRTLSGMKLQQVAGYSKLSTRSTGPTAADLEQIPAWQLPELILGSKSPDLLLPGGLTECFGVQIPRLCCIPMPDPECMPSLAIFCDVNNVDLLDVGWCLPTTRSLNSCVQFLDVLETMSVSSRLFGFAAGGRLAKQAAKQQPQLSQGAVEALGERLRRHVDLRVLELPGYDLGRAPCERLFSQGCQLRRLGLARSVRCF